MSQRVWIILVVVVAVLIFGFFFWPSGTNETAIQPTGEAETAQPADEPATDEPATTE